MLQPKRTKFRKAFKGRIHGNAKGGTELNFGAFGLKAMEPERITARQIEAARRAITRHIKRTGRLWIRVFPDVPVSSKPPFALPWIRPLWAFLNLVRFGESMIPDPYRAVWPSLARLSVASGSCAMISPLNTQTFTPQVP